MPLTMQVVEKDAKVQVVLGDSLGFKLYDFQSQASEIIESPDKESLGPGVDSVPLASSIAVCYKSIQN